MVFLSRRCLLSLTLLLQVVFLAFLLLTGKRGYVYLQKVIEENKKIEEDIKQQECEIIVLHQEVDKWKSSAFLYEKYAREKLHMGKKDETVFFYEESNV